MNPYERIKELELALTKAINMLWHDEWTPEERDKLETILKGGKTEAL